MNVLFTCIGNTCRSQMAEGYGRAWGKAVMNPESAGTFATGMVAPDVVRAMEEEGIDISNQESSQLTAEMIEKADLVVVMGGEPDRLFPGLLEGKSVSWPIPDPYGQSLSRIRQVRDMIKNRVADLIIELSREKRKKS